MAPKNETVRQKTIQCRVSDEEYEEIEKKADQLGLSVGSYLRLICLCAKIEVNFSLNSKDV